MSLSNSTMEESSEPYLYGTMPTVLCCMCGVEIQHNAANMCVSCLRSQHDVCEGIKSQLTIHNCRTCGR
jgi:nonsense-mediated mRNA decay protein 3